MDNFSPEDINDQGSATENEKDINSVDEIVESQTKLKDNKVLLKNLFYALLTLPFLFFT